MKIDFAISIDETEAAKAAIEAALKASFAPPNYSGDKGGAGYEAVKKQVAAHINSLDLSAEIARIAAAKLPAMIDDVVGEALAAAIKKRAKALQAQGELTLGADPGKVA